MSLPTEILQEIISQLDQASLAKCTQVSSQFRALAIPVLYESPILPTVERFRRFAKELTTNNAVYVYTLDLSMTARRWDALKAKEIVDLLSKCLYLMYLDLDMCWALRNSDIEIIMKTIGKNLRFLSLCSCSYLNTVSIAFVALYCHNLQVLNISGICTVDDPLIDLASNNPQLETVNLADCNHITEKSVKAFMKCSKLKYLNIEGCHNVLGFESDGEGDLPQPEWETEEDDDDEDEEDEESYYDDDEDYEGEIIWVSDDDELDDYDSDYVDEEDDDEDYSDISSEEPITEASSNTSNINDNDGDRGFQQQ